MSACASVLGLLGFIFLSSGKVTEPASAYHVVLLLSFLCLCPAGVDLSAGDCPSLKWITACTHLQTF